MICPVTDVVEHMEIDDSCDIPNARGLTEEDNNLDEPVNGTFLPIISCLSLYDMTDEFLIFSEVLTQNSILSIESHGLERKISNFEDEMELVSRQDKINIMTPKLAAALDRTNTSNRDACYLFAHLLKNVELNIDNYNVSYSAIRNNRIKTREAECNTLKEWLQMADHLEVHWDGTLVRDVTEPDTIANVKKVERLAIIVTGIGTEQLLGVPKMKSSTGREQATAVFKSLGEWDVTDRVRALCFDTTSSNTGKYQLR